MKKARHPLVTETYVADFETFTIKSKYYQTKHKTNVYLAGLLKVSDYQYHEFIRREAFLDFIIQLALRKKCKLKIYFHNLKFDMSFIIQDILKKYEFSENRYLKNNQYNMLMGDNRKIYHLTIRLSSKSYLEFRDSHNLFPLPLESLGKVVAMPKLTMSYDEVNHLYQNLQDVPTTIREYLLRDCKIIALMLLNTTNSMLSSKLTMGAFT